MPGHTAAPWEIIYAEAADETKMFPAQVDQIKAERIAKIFGERLLTVKSYAGSATLKSGELAVQGKTGETFTLPLATTANQIIGVFCGAVASTKVTTSGGAIIVGDFVNGATITLATFQHVILVSEGANWIIIAGEAKREQTYAEKNYSQAEAEAGIEFSATRPALVSVHMEAEPGLRVVTVGGETAAAMQRAFQSVTVEVPAGVKLKAAVKIQTYRILR